MAAIRLLFPAHLVAWVLGNALVFLVASGKATAIVALSWGILLVWHGLFAFLAPASRKRATADGRPSGPVRAPMEADERQRLEGRHARALEELSASIAHEIRNPITAAKSLVQQIAEDPTSADNIEYARVALGELERVERSVSHLLKYARDEELVLADVDLADVVASALDALADRVAKSRVTVSRDTEAGSLLRGDAEKLRRVVVNLVANALDATLDRPDGTVRITAGRNLAGSEVWLKVRDNGPGISRDDLPKIWGSFFTSKKTGTGLGLAITKKLVEAHGGSIEATSEGAGAEFVATFPALARAENGGAA
ncbi:MAG: HAMP domain-containing sensor histidine kinase [Polyangiaceae bacterium]